MLPTSSLERRDEIAALLRQGRSALSAGAMPRPVSERSAAIGPALFDGLLDPSVEVRWAAAYAIAALRSPAAFDRETIPADPDRALRDAVLGEVTRFLHDRKTRYITEVDLTRVGRSGGRVHVEGTTSIHDRMPLEVAGARPVLSEVGVAVGGILEVEVAEPDGGIVAVFEASPRPDAEDGPLASCRFQAEVDDAEDLIVHVRINFGGRRLRTHVMRLGRGDAVGPARP